MPGDSWEDMVWGPGRVTVHWFRAPRRKSIKLEQQSGIETTRSSPETGQSIEVEAGVQESPLVGVLSAALAGTVDFLAA